MAADINDLLRQGIVSSRAANRQGIAGNFDYLPHAWEEGIPPLQPQQGGPQPQIPEPDYVDPRIRRGTVPLPPAGKAVQMQPDINRLLHTIGALYSGYVPTHAGAMQMAQTNTGER